VKYVEERREIKGQVARERLTRAQFMRQAGVSSCVKIHERNLSCQSTGDRIL
jgi:hypothetical protein